MHFSPLNYNIDGRARAVTFNITIWPDQVSSHFPPKIHLICPFLRTCSLMAKVASFYDTGNAYKPTRHRIHASIEDRCVKDEKSYQGSRKIFRDVGRAVGLSVGE
jgi:hypothetical protein